MGPPFKIISSPYPELDVLKAQKAQRKHRCRVRTGWIESGLVNLIQPNVRPKNLWRSTVRFVVNPVRSLGTFRSVQSVYSRRPHVASLVKKKIAALVRNREGILEYTSYKLHRICPTPQWFENTQRNTTNKPQNLTKARATNSHYKNPLYSSTFSLWYNSSLTTPQRLVFTSTTKPPNSSNGTGTSPVDFSNEMSKSKWPICHETIRTKMQT